MNFYTMFIIISLLLIFCIYHNQTCCQEYIKLNNIPIKIKLDSTAKIPFHGTPFAAGYDLYSNEEYVVIAPGESRLIMTGIRVEIIGKNYYIQIEGRSSLAKKDIIVMAGIIDSDYRGEIGVLLKNLSYSQFRIRKGERIGQMILKKYYDIEFIETDKLSDTERGEKGFGSTGV